MQLRLKEKCNPQVTIVMPVYNAEEYIVNTTKMVQQQSYSNLEIIMVDDGSTDNTFNILKKFSKNDSRFKILKKENGGMSDARNFGLKHVSSDYVTFVDSDDYVAKDYVETLITPFLRNKKVSISMIKYKRVSVYEKKNFTNSDNSTYLINKYEGLETCLLQKEGYDVAVWGKMYLSTFFNNCRFKKGITYEDLEILPKLFYEIGEDNLVAVIDEIKYQYLKTPDSIITSGFRTRDLDILPIVDNGLIFVSEKMESCKEAYIAKSIAGVFSVYRKAVVSNVEKKYKNEIFATLRRFTKKISWQRKVTKKELVVIIIVMLGQKISKPLVNLIAKLLA
ncbi:glycosyltransferase family 2 protein [Pediococcus pentosaceus]|uniref:glycosyltransferase family 2 protein n=1 Tax=Pediococcus pentosaceus TaxID=1255 RepID=UPI0006D8A7A5|nr:glycosyltransferase family 2 protein [Pediococcus pentosaceus]ANI98170.1 hypothetical protein AN278_006690 [Pediococcus pentosaceus]MBF7113503.1 glycosyltransferase family 2 protein [Pediococcus pentosaceus]MDQ7252943.1 glycosyltransferase family 2 protein [Pediococcus pentosaceus]MDY8106718.1 glycosyltransferase family 2 protein [Pediococcus pentosaceus]UQA99541.1 glycosyltransferase family 2 protein [Pediococcus pentosaceus]